MTNWTEVDAFAKTLIIEAGKQIKASFKQTLNIQTKSNPNDLVTNIDQEIERFFINKIKQTFPDHRILGEEGFGDQISSSEGVVWIIDPIDGTMNFIHQQRNFAISVGIFENGIGQIGLIYDVAHDELYHAKKGTGAFMNEIALPNLSPGSLKESVVSLNATWVTENHRIDQSVLSPIVKEARGTRSYGSAALELAYVAAGRLDAYITLRLSPWDFAAGIVLIEEVGGVISNLKGEKLDCVHNNSLFAAKPSLHQEISEKFLEEFKNER